MAASEQEHGYALVRLRISTLTGNHGSRQREVNGMIGLEARKQKEKAFFELAERFRAAEDPKDVERLGEQLGQMVFGR